MEDKANELNGYIPLDFDECYGVTFNKSQFKKGLDYGSYLSGICSGLLNSGLKTDEVTTVLCKVLEVECRKHENNKDK